MKAANTVEIGNRIKKIRQKRGMSQEQLAFALGYASRSSVAKIESGVNDIPQTLIKKIADTLGVSIDYIMGWEEYGDTGIKVATLSKSKSDLLKMVMEMNDDQVESMSRMLAAFQKMPQQKIG